MGGTTGSVGVPEDVDELGREVEVKVVSVVEEVLSRVSSEEGEVASSEDGGGETIEVRAVAIPGPRAPTAGEVSATTSPSSIISGRFVLVVSRISITSSPPPTVTFREVSSSRDCRILGDIG